MWTGVNNFGLLVVCTLIITSVIAQTCQTDDDCDNEGVCPTAGEACLCPVFIEGDTCDNPDLSKIVDFYYVYYEFPDTVALFNPPPDYTNFEDFFAGAVNEDAAPGTQASVIIATVDHAVTPTRNAISIGVQYSGIPKPSYAQVAVDLKELYTQAVMGGDEYYALSDGLFLSQNFAERVTYKNIPAMLNTGGANVETITPECDEGFEVGDYQGNEIPYCFEGPPPEPALTYNCVANGGCQNDQVCNRDTKKCDCTDTQTNYDCSIEPLDEATLITQCDGICTVENTFGCGGTDCYCKDGFFGTCATERFTAFCQEDSTIIKINPYSPPAKVFLLNPSDNSKVTTCEMTASNDVYSEEYTHASLPGGCENVVLSTTSPLRHTLKVYIQYYAGLYTDNDKVIEVICSGPSANDLVSSITSLNANEVLPNVNTVEEDIPDGVSSGLLDSAGAPYVSGTVDIGTRMHLQVKLEKGLVPDFSWKTLSTSNYEPTEENKATPPAGGASSDIIADWCFNGADATVMSFSVGLTKAFATTEVTMDYEFTTFYYDANPTNYKAIWFEIVVCLGECTATCSVMYDGFEDTTATDSDGRKRREAQEGKEVTMMNKLNVVDKLVPLPQGTKEEDVCFTFTAFIIPVVTLAVLLLFSMLMAVFYCYKYSALNKQEAKKV